MLYDKESQGQSPARILLVCGLVVKKAGINCLLIFEESLNLWAEKKMHPEAVPLEHQRWAENSSFTAVAITKAQQKKDIPLVCGNCVDLTGHKSTIP